ncbi:MAG: hypothetical protein HYZ29_22260 [Myxococcales bacterium]|nr:hypothetical protein [Myxococcales bacterium]
MNERGLADVRSEVEGRGRRASAHDCDAEAARAIVRGIERGSPRVLITREAYLIDAAKQRRAAGATARRPAARSMRGDARWA